MSIKTLLSTLSPGKPILDVPRAILSAPVRHVFMIGTMWFLKQQNRMQPRVLEIGSWYGASALSWAQGLKAYHEGMGTLTCIDGWSPFFDMDIHKDSDYAREMEASLTTDLAYQIFVHNMSTLPPSIDHQHIRGRSEKVLPLLKPEAFDVVFIDADHTFDAVSKDIELAKPLISEGGIICGDDLNLQLFECDEKIAHAHAQVDFIADPKTGRNFHPGVTLAVEKHFGRVSSWGGYWAMQRRGATWHPISLKNMPVVFPEHFPAEKVSQATAHFNDISSSLD